MAFDYIPLWDKYQEEFSVLDPADIGRLVLAMMAYKSGSDPVLEGNERFVWPSIRRDIDSAKANYEKQIVNGSKGGRPSKTCKAGSEGNPAKPSDNPDETQRNPGVTQENPNVTQGNPKEPNRNPDKPTDNPTKTQGNPDVTQKNKLQRQQQRQRHISPDGDIACARESRPPETAAPAAEDIQSLFFDVRKDVSPCSVVPSKRRRAIEARLREGYTLEDFRTVFAKSKSGFLAGENDRGWTASLDWLLESEHFAKVISGEYDQVHARPRAAPRRTRAETQAEIDTERVAQGTAALGAMEREAIARMLREYEESGGNEPEA